MKRKNLLKLLAIAVVCTLAILKIFYTPFKIDPLSVEALYGRWQIKDARGYYHGDREKEVTKETFEHIGKTIEFHKKYIIVDGEQCSNLRYTYYTCASFGDQVSLDEVHVLELPYRIDYWYENVDKNSDYIRISPSIDGTKSTPAWLYDRFTLVSDKLYVGYLAGFLYLERIPDRPWWQRAHSYLKAVFAPPYDATKIMPQEMWGHWEIIEINKYWSKVYKNDPDDEWTKWEQERFTKHKGKRFILHPKYVILEGKQYNNPRYRESLKADKTKCYFLDDYNGYKMEGEDLAWSGIFCIDKQEGFQTEDYVCRRLPPPSLWQRVKYYWNYLIDKDDSSRGDFFNQKSREKKG